MSLLASLSTRGKITLAACALGFLFAALMLVKMAGSPSYSTVMAGVDPQQTSKVTAALAEQGIGYELQNGGTAIAVEKGKVQQAQAALAGKGLNAAGTTQPGYELLDKQKLGASSLQQQIAYQRALEGQIAQTIGQIDGVSGAQVRLTMPKDDLFADEARPATAAVLLGGDSSSMDPGAVRGIANLVASSVPQLKPSSVTITDATGQMLWPSEGGAGGDGSLASKPAAEARYNAQLASQVDAMLTRTLGADKAQVQINSDLSVDKATEEKLEYADKGVPLTQTKESEQLQGAGAGAAAGAAGTTANAPSYTNGANGTAAGGSGNYKNTKTETQFGVNKTVTRTQKAPGAVNKLSVSVMVDKNAKPDIPAITKAVEAAVGFDKARGDVVQVQAVPFAKVAPAKPAGGALPIPPAFSGILKGAAIGLGALLFLFFVTRHLRKREAEALMDEPSWLKQLDGIRPAMLQAPALQLPDQPTVQMPSVATADPRRQQLDQIITSEPERVAAHLRTWITEDNK
ncbi:MAG: flagellar M-ring protein FliF [Solirubrobacterales bacterium]|nr:flagellar M-ring protein FliF [Solirubrobacterales bacterium]